MLRTVRGLSLALGVCAAFAAAVATGCGGGGGGDRLSGPDYFAKLQELDDASEASQQELRESYDNAIAGLPEADFTDERRAAEITFYEGLLAVGKDYVNEVDDLAPPGRIQDQHDEYVAAYDEVLIQLNLIVEQLPAIDTMDVFTAVIASDAVAGAYERANAACVALQEAAPVVDAQVDLRCRG